MNKIPEDLHCWLADPSTSKSFETEGAGPFTLNGLEDLTLHLIPADLDDTEFIIGDDVVYGHKDDPHHGEEGCYLVKGVNLVKECELHEPFGLLLWLPDYGSYGIWDSSHIVLYTFDKDVTWTEIINNIERYVDAGWDVTSKEKTVLLPWPDNPYSPERIYSPQPLDKKSSVIS